MTIYIGVSAAVMVIGLLMYILAINNKVVEIGRIMFAFGLFAVLMTFPK